MYMKIRKKISRKIIKIIKIIIAIIFSKINNRRKSKSYLKTWKDI